MTETNSFLTNIKNFLHFNEKDFHYDNNQIDWSLPRENFDINLELETPLHLLNQKIGKDTAFEKDEKTERVGTIKPRLSKGIKTSVRRTRKR